MRIEIHFDETIVPQLTLFVFLYVSTMVFSKRSFCNRLMKMFYSKFDSNFEFEKLPMEIQLEILKKMDCETLLSMKMTNKFFYNLIWNQKKKLQRQSANTLHITQRKSFHALFSLEADQPMEKLREKSFNWFLFNRDLDTIIFEKFRFSIVVINRMLRLQEMTNFRAKNIVFRQCCVMPNITRLQPLIDALKAECFKIEHSDDISGTINIKSMILKCDELDPRFIVDSTFNSLRISCDILNPDDCLKEFVQKWCDGKNSCEFLYMDFCDVSMNKVLADLNHKVEKEDEYVYILKSCKGRTARIDVSNSAFVFSLV